MRERRGRERVAEHAALDIPPDIDGNQASAVSRNPELAGGGLDEAADGMRADQGIAAREAGDSANAVGSAVVIPAPVTSEPTQMRPSRS